MRRSDAGFTLTEAMIVMVIAGVLLSLGLPKFNAMRQGIQIDGAAQQLLGDLRRAQVEAIKRNTSIRLVTTGASTYTIDSIGPRSLDGGVTFGPTSSPSVRMASFGPPTTGAAVFILQLGSRTKTVRVNAVGFVSVQ